ncbi:RGS domain-containing protein [Entamoeba marina]
MESQKQHIRFVSHFIDEVVDSIITRDQFDQHFHFIEAHKRTELFLRHKYQLKHFLYIKIFYNPSILEQLETSLYNKLAQNNAHQQILDITQEVYKPLPVDKIHQTCKQALEHTTQPMEPASDEDKIFPMFSDILQISEKLTNGISAIYKPLDDDDEFY